jgi:hypothetical protein
MKKLHKLGIVAAIGVVLAAGFDFAGKRELARIGTPLPHPATSAATLPVIDTAALLADVQTLASPQFAGRRTGSDGSRLAQAYLTKRFQEIGIAPFGAGYGMPFGFTHTSIRGMLTPGRQARTEYPSALNLIGHIRGSAHPDRYMVVSAHYDHLGVRDGAVYLGADDNASGVAAMLAVARYFKQHPPRNTIVFAAFDSEELGKRGAEALVKGAPFPIANVALNLNFDMVSRSDKNEIFASGVSYTPSLKPLVAQAAAGSGVNVKLGHDRSIFVAGNVEDWTGMSDHAAFHDAGIPYLYFGVEDHADYHQPSDSFEKIDPAFFGDVVRLLVSAAAILDRNLDAVK